MLCHWQLLLICAAQASALPTQGPGTQWVGVNGGYREDYTDKSGRVWHNSVDRWTPSGWGGWIGTEAPLTYSNTWGSPRLQCKNWPPEYDQDYDALLHHYSREPGSGTPMIIRANLQQEEEPVSYYTVKWNFCEKDFHGGAVMDFWINGNLVKHGYETKHHHIRTDIYHWKCIPTVQGKIELRIEGRNWTKSDSQGIQARYSTIEFEKTLDGCDLCEGVSCGKGICSTSTFWDQVYLFQMGSKGVANHFHSQTPSTTSGVCHCATGVTGKTCDIGTCAMVSCNEPFGGTCSGGQCSCLNGHSGAHCATKPDVDRFGCYNRTDVATSQLQVSTLCLPEKIAGPTDFNAIRGPAPMNTVADKNREGVAYFSWTSDRRWGKKSNAGLDGRIYVSKILLQRGKLPVLSKSTAFDGFMRAGGIDMTEDGYIGTLCAKWFPSWYFDWKWFKHFSPLVLAVCEIDSSDMSIHGTPWQIGKQYQEHGYDRSTGIWGTYPLAHPKFGYGQLQYSPHHRSWSAWYGATVGYHTGSAMHTFRADAAKISDEAYNKYELPVPRDQIESREEWFGDFSRGGRLGTGDHQSGSAWRYHPILHDIGMHKHNGGQPVYMQQYGLEMPAGKFAPPGYSTGQVEMRKDSKAQATEEGSLRPCADGWIMGFVAKNDNVCAKVDRAGNINVWRVIDASAARPIPGTYHSMVRIAPLGSAEDAALCGSTARFLYGYEREDHSRWLVELDGDCNELIGTRQDVTAYTHWPHWQEWATTKDGAVVWVTTWHTDQAGKFGPKNSPNGIHTYEPQPADKSRTDTPHGDIFLDTFDGYRFGLTPDATNEAKITVYYPDHVVTTAPPTLGTTAAPPTSATTASPSSASTAPPASITTTTTSTAAQVPWTTLYSTGTFGSVLNPKEEFNRLFQQAMSGIARRECTDCIGTHADVYYRRKQQPSQYDAWEGLMVTWRGDLNFHSHFDIYSSFEDALADQNAWKWCNGNDPNIGFPRDCGPSGWAPNQWNSLTHGGRNNYKWSVQFPASTTTTTTTSSVTADTGIQSGDMVFLSTRSGEGNMIDVEGSAVQSRWVARGNWQVIIIEKKGSGWVNSGDVVYLKTHTGAHIDVSGQMVQARWSEQGDWQAIVIEKRNGSGPIHSDDVVCFKAHTGNRLDVEGNIVQARWSECGDWQAMRIEKEVADALVSGNSIHLLAHTGKRLEVEGAAVQARWGEAGVWQTFVIRNNGGRAIFSGDIVSLQAHTGMMVDVQEQEVQARWNDMGVWQRLVIEKKNGNGAILPGDTVLLRAHTGKMLDVQGNAVQARFFDRGVWQALVIEKSMKRRLSRTVCNEWCVRAFKGMSVSTIHAVVIVLVSVAAVALKCREHCVMYKVQPFEE